MSEPTISPTPSDDEVVAIMAAAQALWPAPPSVNRSTAARSAPWRFSGRWWARPVAVRRARPYY